MSHFAVIAPPFTSHFRALEAMAGRLLDAGHRVTFLHQVEAGALLRDPRIGFEPLGLASHPPSSLPAIVRRAARPGGPLGLRRVILDLAHGTDMLCREAPARLRALGVDALIADQMEAAGGLIAEHLGLPWVSVACALPVNREARIPLPVMPWGFARRPFDWQLNEGSTRVYDALMAPHARVIAAWADAFALSPRHALHHCLSPYAQISQTVAAFDFPRHELPAHFHAVGPLRGPQGAEPSLELPGFDSGRRLAFASLGTLQGGRLRLFRRIARACRDLDVQLALAHCGQLDIAAERVLAKDGAQWVTDFFPQQELLARADLSITHAGLNTVMDALVAGTPMLALPIAFDQPGVAARIAHHGVGLRLLPALASRRRLRTGLEQLLADPTYAARARQLGTAVTAAGGSQRAAEIVAQVLASGQPVTGSDRHVA